MIYDIENIGSPCPKQRSYTGKRENRASAGGSGKGRISRQSKRLRKKRGSVLRKKGRRSGRMNNGLSVMRK